MTDAARIADILLDIGAVHVNAETPFIFTSGWASPVYIDCRKLISYLPERRAVIDAAVKKLKTLGDVDFVAGGETAGIPYAAWISEAMDRPMLYVRKKPKGFGRNAQIEGSFPEGAKVLLVEDLATDGGSKVAFADALRAAGAGVTDVFSVFFYGIYQESEEILSSANLKLHSLCTWADVLAAVKRRNLFDAAAVREIEAFLKAPADWSKAHGGVYTRARTA